MVKSKLLELAEEVQKKAFKIFNAEGEIDNQVWFLQAENGDKMLIGAEIEDRSMKGPLANHLRKFFKEKKIVRYVTVSESWYVTEKKVGEKLLDLTNIPMPSEHPQREEAVLITGEDRDTGEVVFRMFKIDRSGDKPKLIKDLDEHEDEKGSRKELGGIFSNLFDRPKRTLH